MPIICGNIIEAGQTVKSYRTNCCGKKSSLPGPGTPPTYPCLTIIFNNIGSGENIGYSYKNCNGGLVSGFVIDGNTLQVCGSNPVSNNIKMSYTIGANC